MYKELNSKKYDKTDNSTSIVNLINDKHLALNSRFDQGIVYY